MTEQHSQMGGEFEEAKQSDSKQKRMEGAFHIKKEAETHDADIADKKVRTEIAKDIRPMRRWAVRFAILLPIVLLIGLYAKINSYLGLLTLTCPDDAAACEAKVKAMAAAVESLSMPMTALVIGTFVCVTAIYSALLLGLFRSSESDKKKAAAGMHPAVSTIRVLFGGGE